MHRVSERNTVGHFYFYDKRCICICIEQVKNTDKLKLDKGDYNRLRKFLDIKWDNLLLEPDILMKCGINLNLLYCTVLNCTEDYGRRLLHASMSTSLYLFNHLNRLILTTLINSCQTSGFSKVGAIIKYNIMHFPVLIKTVFKLVYINKLSFFKHLLS